MTDADWRNGRTRDDLLAMLTFVQGRWDERQGRLFGAAVMRRVWDLLTDPRYRGLVVALERWVTGVTGESDYVAARQRLPAIANWRTAGIVNFRELPYWVQQTHSATVALGDFDLRVVVLSAAAARANHTAEQSAELKPFDEQIAAIDRDSDRFQREYDDAVWRGMSSAERKGETLRLRREQADVQIRQLRAEQRELRQQLDAAARDSEHAAQADLLRCVAGSPFTSAVFAPRWRSETVALLVRGIVADRAFDRLPVLADALEEAGCDHPDVLSHCRTPGPHAVGCWVLRGLAESGGRPLLKMGQHHRGVWQTVAAAERAATLRPAVPPVVPLGRVTFRRGRLSRTRPADTVILTPVPPARGSPCRSPTWTKSCSSGSWPRRPGRGTTSSIATSA